MIARLVEQFGPAVVFVLLCELARRMRDRRRADRTIDESLIPPRFNLSRQTSRAYMRGLSEEAVRHAAEVRRRRRHERPSWWRRLTGRSA